MTRSSHMGTKSPHTGKHQEKLLDCEEAGVSYRCSIQLQVGSPDVKHIPTGAGWAIAALTQVVIPQRPGYISDKETWSQWYPSIPLTSEYSSSSSAHHIRPRRPETPQRTQCRL